MAARAYRAPGAGRDDFRAAGRWHWIGECNENRGKILRLWRWGLRLTHEIARAVQFLADDEAGFITGSVISVNGGMDM